MGSLAARSSMAPPMVAASTEVETKPMNEGSPPQATVRTARPADSASICRLVNAWADEGLTLRRTEEEIRVNSGEFVLAERPGYGPVACGALAVFSPSLAEIRSVAVEPMAKGTGAGRSVMVFLLDVARTLEVDEVVLLTKVPGFFARFGFHPIEPGELPGPFMEEAIAGRGRTIQGRTIMLRSLL